MTIRQYGTLAILLLLGRLSSADAEYLIYLKGGHFIVADDCTFSAYQGAGQSGGAAAESSSVEECTREKKPREGRISWRTINGDSGEVNADDVYDILGTKSLSAIKPTVTARPLEDYLITNRGDSFVNAKAVGQKDAAIYGLKRDELTEIDRRSIIEIAPESVAKGRSGEGLCPGEPPEFLVSEVSIVNDHFIAIITNTSKAPWRPLVDVEVSAKGGRRGKFRIEDSNLLASHESTSIDQLVPTRFQKEIDRLGDDQAAVRLCYRKVKTTTGQSK